MVCGGHCTCCFSVFRQLFKLSRLVFWWSIFVINKHYQNKKDAATTITHFSHNKAKQCKCSITPHTSTSVSPNRLTFHDRVMQQSLWSSTYCLTPAYIGGAEIAQWLECQTPDWKVPGSSPSRSSGITVFSRVNFLCWLLFQYLFHPCVTTVAHKRSQSFCQKCTWQVTVKHTCTLCMWLSMKWPDMVHGCMEYMKCTEMAVVSHGTSHVSAVSTPLWWIFKNML